MKKNKMLNNTIMLMIFNISKLVFPFITLPYLTRVLTSETYGTVTYVKTVMSYMQILVDFGFILSATKSIVKAKNNSKKIGEIAGETLLARMILGLIGFVVLFILTIALPILRNNILYTFLSYIAVFASIFLMDYLFRGIEKMHIITIRFIVMKTISTIMTFFMIKNDNNILMLPVLDVLSTIVAIILVVYEIKKIEIKLQMPKNIKKAICSIKESFVYFLSNVASTSFNALSTIIIGIKISASEVAYWGVCMQIIGSIQACYTPISEGIYPEMIKTKNINIIKKVLKLLLPVVIVGCIFSYFFAETGLMILGGIEYTKAVPILRILIPVLFFGFLAIIFGWPTLGAIDKSKETTKSTIITISVNISLLIFLLITNRFTLINIAIVRTFSEFVLFITRFYFYRKYRNLFNSERQERKNESGSNNITYSV